MTTTPAALSGSTRACAPVLLLPGHWLGAWAWDAVLERLDAEDVHAVAMTLPGLDPDDADRLTRTLADQVAALEAAAEALVAERGPVVLVAHSGANAPASVLLDARPDLVRAVVWVDSGPIGPGAAAPALPPGLVEVPLPAFDVLGQQASLEGLTPSVLEEFRSRAVGEPAMVVAAEVGIATGAGRRVPALFVCCSLGSADVQAMAEAGHPMFAEVSHCEQARFVDLPTGHWPMWSRPDDLAVLIAEAAGVAR